MNTTRPMVKVCGITRQEDADACVDAGVDMLGFIFHPASPRNIRLEDAAAIDTGSAKRVGVFVNQGQDEVLSIMKHAKLDYAQLCGDQDRSFCRAVGPQQVIRVFWPERFKALPALLDEVARYDGFISYALLDAGLSGGGHGRVQDFELLSRFNPPMQWLLAGGLSPSTLPQAMEKCTPNGYDLNSGLESKPGVKDHTLVREAIGLVRTRENKE